MCIDTSFIYEFFSFYSFSSIKEENGIIEAHISGIGDKGEGVMRIHPVMDGIAISYIDLNLKSCFQKVEPISGFLEINYCISGSYEVVLSDNQVCYLSDSDMSLSMPEKIRLTASRVPSGSYKGIAFIIKREKADVALRKNFPFLDLNLERLESLFSEKSVYFLRGRSEICHLFHELESINPTISARYLPLKTAEMLLILLEGMIEDEEMLPQFSRTVVERTRRCYSFLLNHPIERHTSKELSAKYHLAETSLRQCFKSIYGLPIGSFQKELRIKEAEKMLREDSSISIGEVACKCGYENQSKFASAFKSVTGKTPALYRKHYATFSEGEE